MAAAYARKMTKLGTAFLTVRRGRTLGHMNAVSNELQQVDAHLQLVIELYLIAYIRNLHGGKPNAYREHVLQCVRCPQKEKKAAFG